MGEKNWKIVSPTPLPCGLQNRYMYPFLWLAESWSDTPIWTHPVAVAIPDTLRSTDTAFTFVLGTNYNDNPEWVTRQFQQGYANVTLKIAQMAAALFHAN